MNMEKKFTPGPWMWNGAAGITEVKGEPRDRIRICDVWNGENGCYLNHPDYIVKANANLISAAPELLSILERLVMYYDHGELFPEEGYKITEAKRVIAKAYGENK